MTPDVIVIGGGFAGLSAATRLAERGRRVLVLEARRLLGGRAAAFTDPATGERVDNGQHVLFGCYRETFRFLRRIGAEHHVRIQPRLSLDIVDREGRASRLSCPPLPPPFHLLGGVLTWDALGWRDRLTALRIANAIGSGRHGAAGEAAESGRRSKETVREWLVRFGQTPRLIELLWEPLAVAALNQPIDAAAAEPFVGVVRLLFGRGRHDAALALPLKPLDELYAHPARAYLEQRGGVIRTASPATVELGPAPSVRVRDERLAAPRIVCAVPWYALPEVLPSPPREMEAVVAAARDTAACPIVTVNLWFDRIVMGRDLVGLPARTMQWVFDKRSVFGETASHLSLVSSGAAAVVALSNQELIDLAMREIGEALPAVHGARLQRAVVVRERRATFSVAPGQPPRPPTRTPVPGLLLAGDWIDTGLPATIEGAVLSGHHAAEAALS